MTAATPTTPATRSTPAAADGQLRLPSRPLRRQLRQLFWLSHRSTLRTFRSPAAVVPTLAFPLVLLLVLGSGLASSTAVPGFPTDTYLAFAFGGVFMHAGMLAGLNAGADLASDIENRFLSRLALAPIRRWQLIVGQLAGALVFAFFHGAVYIALGLVLGVQFASGAAGLAVILAMGIVATLGFSGLSAMLAALTGSSESVRALFPMYFVILTFSSYFLPRHLLDVDWFRVLATVNPFSYLIEATRSLIITGWDARALITGFGIGAALAVLTVAGTALGLRSKWVAR